MVSSNQSPMDSNTDLETVRTELKELRKQVEATGKDNWFRFLVSFGFTMMAVGVGIGFSSPPNIDPLNKSVIGIALVIFGLIVEVRTIRWYRPERISRSLVTSAIVTLNLGAVILLVGNLLRTEFDIVVPFLILIGVMVIIIGFFIAFISLSKLHIRI
jgi:hypothetical protein